MSEFVKKQIQTLEDEIKTLTEKIEYNDSVNQPVNHLGQKLEEKQAMLESLKKFVSN